MTKDIELIESKSTSWGAFKTVIDEADSRIMGSFTFNGVTMPLNASSVSYQPSKREPAYGMDLSMLRREGAHASYSVETAIPISGVKEWARLLLNEPTGASPQTLARRVSYGGRKGRSAMRRLLARALPVELATADGLRFRGRCVMLNAHEIVIKMSSHSRGRR